MRTCISCKKILETRDQIKFCSNKCQAGYQYRVFVVKWKSRTVEGGVGILTKTVSGHLRKYLFNKYGESCSLCRWNRRNPITGKVPLEIDHIDGNSENNTEDNLRLICPNCHSLTVHFRNLNKGHGRKWRMNKYIKHAEYKNENR